MYEIKYHFSYEARVVAASIQTHTHIHLPHKKNEKIDNSQKKFPSIIYSLENSVKKAHLLWLLLDKNTKEEAK